MLHKNLVLISISSLFLSYIPCTQASHADGYSNKVNSVSWRGFVREKQRKYALNHTIDKAPLPKSISSGDVVKVDLGKLAWGAYDSNGKLVRWGDASGGKSFCDDIGKGCKTVTGTFTFYKKQGSGCKSNQFPVGRGGAPMPYCMHFSGGYAMHGGFVPDFNASHGCVRVPVHEAQWLNQNFVKVGKTKISISYN